MWCGMQETVACSAVRRLASLLNTHLNNSLHSSQCVMGTERKSLTQSFTWGTTLCLGWSALLQLILLPSIPWTKTGVSIVTESYKAVLQKSGLGICQKTSQELVRAATSSYEGGKSATQTLILSYSGCAAAIVWFYCGQGGIIYLFIYWDKVLSCSQGLLPTLYIAKTDLKCPASWVLGL